MKHVFITTLYVMALLLETIHAQDTGGNAGSSRPTIEPSTRADGDDKRPPPRRDRVRDRSLPQISVIDKLLAVESALNSTLARTNEAEWVRDYQRLYSRFRENGHVDAIREQGKNQAYVALALGVKASDAVLALKARDLEALNVCAEQIDLLARNLGATDGELGMAGTVRHYANKKQWFSAFLALGRMQRDVTNYLESSTDKRKRDLAILVAIGGWMQGGRVVTYVIDANYTDWSSNVLREPRLVDLIQENLASIDPGYLNDELVSKIMKALPDIHRLVDVGLNAPVKRADVRELNSIFTSFVEAVMAGKAKDNARPENQPKAPVPEQKKTSDTSVKAPLEASKEPTAPSPTVPAASTPAPKSDEAPTKKAEQPLPPAAPPVPTTQLPAKSPEAERPSALKATQQKSSSSWSVIVIAALVAGLGGGLWYRKSQG